MDLARLTELNVDQILEALMTTPWNGPTETPVDLSNREFFKCILYGNLNSCLR